MLASEYGWPRHEIWWEIPIAEVMIYLNLIAARKQREWGTGDEPVDVELLEILDLIEKVKQEKANGEI